MLDSITIKNCFLHKDSKFEFQTGMTAITGLNGRGKSQILEMVRFALFGSAALRTEAGDYKGAKIDLAFRIRDVKYSVSRSTATAKLCRGSDVICTGTRPVNIKIAELFGYGLEVFDTANVANQGVIEALSNMQPAQRKRLIDNVVGLNLIDDLAKWCAEEALARGKEAVAVSSVLVSPVAPQEPQGYQPSAELAVLRAGLVAKADEYRGLARQIVAIPADSERPVTSVTQTLDELETISRSRRTLIKQRAHLYAQVNDLPLTNFTSEEVDAWEEKLTTWKSHKAACDFAVAYMDPVTYTLEEIEGMYRDLNASNSYLAWKRLVGAGSHVCPKCEHTWPIKAHEIEEDWTGKPEPLRPSSDARTLGKMMEARRALDDRAAEATNARIIMAIHGASYGPPPCSIASITDARSALAKAPQREALAAALLSTSAELDAIRDLSGELVAREAYETALKTWEGIQVQRAALPALAARLNELTGVCEEAERVGRLLTEAVVYERMSEQYAKSVKTYETGKLRVLSLEAEREEYTKARVSLAEIKSRVKTHLVPSLSRVASGLLHRMTGGAFAEIKVNEDFDITVDGTAIDGLSGAGKAAANLALRIGLGQVLTNKVFSVVMLDEPDAMMDEERVDFFAQCIRNLSSTISQVVVVSHKRPEADHYISL